MILAMAVNFWKTGVEVAGIDDIVRIFFHGLKFSNNFEPIKKILHFTYVIFFKQSLNSLVITEVTVEPEWQPVVIVVQLRNVQEVGDKLSEAWHRDCFCQDGVFRKIEDLC